MPCAVTLSISSRRVTVFWYVGSSTFTTSSFFSSSFFSSAVSSFFSATASSFFSASASASASSASFFSSASAFAAAAFSSSSSFFAASCASLSSSASSFAASSAAALVTSETMGETTVWLKKTILRISLLCSILFCLVRATRMYAMNAFTTSPLRISSAISSVRRTEFLAALHRSRSSGVNASVPTDIAACTCDLYTAPQISRVHASTTSLGTHSSRRTRESASTSSSVSDFFSITCSILVR
mmetsp:Transcript_8000/g.33439  ORF Transcript_8000/g.33439 Transcript_8000/m.33439 type:complete len:242 (+) Transcript_8000:1116-1841(+)